MIYELKLVASGYWKLACLQAPGCRPVAAFWFAEVEEAEAALKEATLHKSDLDALLCLSNAIAEDRLLFPLDLSEIGIIPETDS